MNLEVRTVQVSTQSHPLRRTSEVKSMQKESFFERLLYKILLLDYIKDDYALEFQNASIKLVVGFLLFIIGPYIFPKYGDVYRYLNFFDARVWGLIFVTIGVVHIYALFNKKHSLRKNILLVAGVLWLWFGMLIFIGTSISFMPYIAAVFCFSSFRCYLCIQFFDRFEMEKTVG